MCLNPRRILNNTKSFDIAKDKLYMYVPCGKCEECKASAREAWFVRSFFEWQRHPNSTYFYTLTFDEEHLPKYHGFRCFDKRLVQLFFKRLRKALDKLDITCKYLIVSEFGELYKRPHHHMQLFLSRPLPPFMLKRIIEKAWSYGFCVPGDNGGLINSQQGLRYVVKYITKDDSFVEKYEAVFVRFLIRKWYRKYLETDIMHVRPPKNRLNFITTDKQPWEIPTDHATFNNFYAAGLRDYQQMMPFHLQSTNLGMSAKEHIYSDSQKLINIVGDGTRAIPRYIQRKLWMDKTPNFLDGNMTGFARSSEGREHFLKTYEIDRDERQSQISDSINYFTSCNDSERFEILKMYNYRNGSVNDMDYIKSLLSIYKIDSEKQLLALYMQFYRGRLDLYEDTISKADFLVHQRLIYIRHLYAMSTAEPFHLKQLAYKPFNKCNVDCGNVFDLIYYEFDKNRPFIEALSIYLWDNSQIFMNCEQAAVLIDSIDLYRRKLLMADRKQKNDAQRRLRQRYKKLKLFNP